MAAAGNPGTSGNAAANNSSGITIQAFSPGVGPPPSSRSPIHAPTDDASGNHAVNHNGTGVPRVTT